MIRMGDKEKVGGVDRDDFMELMKELGLWGKDKDKQLEDEFDKENTAKERREEFLKQEQELYRNGQMPGKPGV